MKRLILLLSLILATTLNTTITYAEEILLSSGSGPIDSVIGPVKDAFEQDSNIRLNLFFGSASLAFKLLYNGTSEAASVGTDFGEILELMKKEQFEVKNPEQFQHVIIGKAMVRTVVNSSNPITKLSAEQLKDIFSGKITNWQEVGGQDMPIIVVVSTLNPATTATFSKAIMQDKPFKRELLELGHMNELRDAVTITKEAIAFGTSALLGEGTRQIETPEIFRPIILITKGKPAPKVQKLIDYILTGPGKSLIKE